MKEALIDTDTLSYFFRNHKQAVDKIDQYLAHFGHINISVVTYYEVLNGLFFKDAKRQLQAFEEFAALNMVIPLNEGIAHRSAKLFADLRKKGKTIGHNDILIAGTAIEHDMVLLTNNLSHFKLVKGLSIDHWDLKKEE
jgi:tRNA(fMet)-specific endonuclease VapC